MCYWSKELEAFRSPSSNYYFEQLQYHLSLKFNLHWLLRLNTTIWIESYHQTVLPWPSIVPSSKGARLESILYGFKNGQIQAIESDRLITNYNKCFKVSLMTSSFFTLICFTFSLSKDIFGVSGYSLQNHNRYSRLATLRFQQLRQMVPTFNCKDLLWTLSKVLQSSLAWHLLRFTNEIYFRQNWAKSLRFCASSTDIIDVEDDWAWLITFM